MVLFCLILLNNRKNPPKKQENKKVKRTFTKTSGGNTMKPIQIDIIAGFLGAGKTTLINKLLDEAYIGEKVAVLENEFGAVSIDGDFIHTANNATVQIKEIANGCICCTLRSSLTAGLIEICHDFAPDRIIIEPTGLADLEDIAAPIEDAAKECPIMIDHVITVVSATHYHALKATIGPFLEKQISNAGLVILSRTEEKNTEAIGEEIRKSFPHLPVIDQPWSNISGLTMIDMVKPYPLHDHSHDHCQHDHHHTAPDYHFYCAKTDHVFSKEQVDALESLFQGKEGGDIYRAKGILKGETGGFRFDFVGGSFSLTPFDVSGSGKFTVIGKNIKQSFWEKTIGTKSL
jgi:G3E family GTPase